MSTVSSKPPTNIPSKRLTQHMGSITRLLLACSFVSDCFVKLLSYSFLSHYPPTCTQTAHTSRISCELVEFGYGLVVELVDWEGRALLGWMFRRLLTTAFMRALLATVSIV